MIYNHEDIAKIYPNSLNTVRINTVKVSGGTTIVSASFRMGNENAVVDNLSNGGIVATIDIQSGIVITSGINKYYNKFIVHPDTKEIIIGIKIPYWEEVKNMSYDLAQTIEKFKYVGWDIGITQNGPVLIEANGRAEMRMQQLADKVGKYPIYKSIIKNI